MALGLSLVKGKRSSRELTSNSLFPKERKTKSKELTSTTGIVDCGLFLFSVVLAFTSLASRCFPAAVAVAAVVTTVSGGDSLLELISCALLLYFLFFYLKL